MRNIARRPVADCGSGGGSRPETAPSQKMIGASVVAHGVQGRLYHLGGDTPRHYATHCGRIVVRFDHQNDASMQVAVDGRPTKLYTITLANSEKNSRSKGRFKRFGTF